MSISITKNLLFPYLMIASTITSIEQPKIQEQLNQHSNLNCCNNLNPIAVSESNKSNSSNITIIDIDSNIDSNIEINHENQYSGIQSIQTSSIKYQFKNILYNESSWNITALDSIFKVINDTTSNSNSREAQVQSINYQLIKSNSNQYNQQESNEILQLKHILLTLLSLGLLGSLGLLVYYKNKQNIDLRYQYLYRIYSIDNNSRTFSFWIYQNLNNSINHIIIVSYRLFSFLRKKFDISQAHLYVSSLNHYSPI